MGIRRYVANADNTLTNAFKGDMQTRGTGANMGRADTMEMFHIYGQESSASHEVSRILIQFPIDEVNTDRTNNILPASGSVSFFLRMYNVEHASTVPRDFTAVIYPVSQSWEEGDGLDMESYNDVTYDATGSNWINASSGTAWNTMGGHYLTESAFTASQYTLTFNQGIEDIELDISEMVENWILGASNADSKTFDNYGLGLQLTSSLESGSLTEYTKKFFARSSEYFFKRPVIEARWDSSKKDDRSNFYYSSSLMTAADNLNTLYLYNYIKGQLKDIPGLATGSVFVSFYSGSADSTTPDTQRLVAVADGTHVTSDNVYAATGGHVSTGIYSCSIALTAAATALTTIFEVWHSGTTQFRTGSFKPSTIDAAGYYPNPELIVNITNLKNNCFRKERAIRVRLYKRVKD